MNLQNHLQDRRSAAHRIVVRLIPLLTVAIGLFVISPAYAQRQARNAKNAKPGEITIAAVGDIMLGSTYPNPHALPAHDGRNLLTPVTSALKGDIVFGNLEGPLTDTGTTAKRGKSSFAFKVPTRYGMYLKRAGFRVLNMANNHSGDFGAVGRRSTRQVLDRLGIAYTGLIGDVAHLSVQGRRIAVIGFAPNSGCYNLNNIPAAQRTVSALVRQGNLVIVSFHGGGEGGGRQHVLRGAEVYLGENRGDLRRFAHSMIESGAALVIGHGPHVVRGMEVYKKHLIAYSLGNFATYGQFGLNGATALSCILKIRLASDGTFTGGRILPCFQRKPGGPHFDASRAVIPVVQSLSRADFGRTAAKIETNGTIRRL